LERTPEKFKYFCTIKDICLYVSLGAYNISKIVIDQTAGVLLNICPNEEILDNNLVSILVPEYNSVVLNKSTSRHTHTSIQN